MDSLGKLIYLDREFISAVYEKQFNVSPQTVITTTQGREAGANIPLFSAGISASESKSFSLSTIAMWEQLQHHLLTHPAFSDLNYEYGKSSEICWIEGTLTISVIRITNKKQTYQLGADPEHKEAKHVASEESYFLVKTSAERFALVPTENYFVSAIAQLRALTGPVIDKLGIPVRALVRVMSAKTPTGDFIAIPFGISEP